MSPAECALASERNMLQTKLGRARKHDEDSYSTKFHMASEPSFACHAARKRKSQLPATLLLPATSAPWGFDVPIDFA